MGRLRKSSNMSDGKKNIIRYLHITGLPPLGCIKLKQRL
jgi:hypothetical protein